MLGEPQILGQVKSALALSKEAQTVSPELNSVFEYAFTPLNVCALKQL